MMNLTLRFIRFFRLQFLGVAGLLGCFSWPVFAAVDSGVANSTEQSTTVATTTAATSGYGTAKDWGLTPAEWAQYQLLMQGPSGLWYRQMSPVAVLGLNARDADDEKHFADVYAKQEHQKVEHELSFNKAAFDAMRRLYPDEPMIKPLDVTVFNPTKPGQKGNKAAKNAAPFISGTTLQSGDRVVLFADTQQGLDVAVLPKLLGLMTHNDQVKLDIYCLGDVKDDAIQSWAKLNQIPTAWVASGRITLNRDKGQLQKISGNINAVAPYIVLVRGSQSRPVSVWDLG